MELTRKVKANLVYEITEMCLRLPQPALALIHAFTARMRVAYGRKG
jgi:hypothetical protein